MSLGVNGMKPSSPGAGTDDLMCAGLDRDTLYTIKAYYPTSKVIVLDCYPNVRYNEDMFEAVEV